MKAGRNKTQACKRLILFVAVQEDVKDTASGSDARAKQDYFCALVLLNADGQKFDNVMAAINSSKCASCDVTLPAVLQKSSYFAWPLATYL